MIRRNKPRNHVKVHNGLIVFLGAYLVLLRNCLETKPNKILGSLLDRDGVHINSKAAPRIWPGVE